MERIWYGLRRRFWARVLRGASLGKGICVNNSFVVEGASHLRVGNGVSFNAGVYINAANGITIGNNVHLSAHCMLISEGLENGQHAGAPIVIEDGVWICAGATVLQGVTIGKGAIVGAGAVVTKDVAPHTTVVGIPARYLKDNNLFAGQTFHCACGMKFPSIEKISEHMKL